MALSGYDLSREWFDWCFENPEKINPNHTALYFFCIEHCNRMGWAEKFGLPMEMAKSAIGIRNYKTYSKTFKDLEDFGFIKVIERSKNQYSANIIALVKNTKANTKALTKATQKHSQKQVHGIVGINKPITIEPITLEPIFEINEITEQEINTTIEFVSITGYKNFNVNQVKDFWKAFLTISEKEFYKNRSEKIKHFRNWLKKQDFIAEISTAPVKSFRERKGEELMKKLI